MLYYFGACGYFPSNLEIIGGIVRFEGLDVIGNMGID
jgi:hypothetical protein